MNTEVRRQEKIDMAEERDSRKRRTTRKVYSKNFI